MFDVGLMSHLQFYEHVDVNPLPETLQTIQLATWQTKNFNYLKI